MTEDHEGLRHSEVVSGYIDEDATERTELTPVAKMLIILIVMVSLALLAVSILVWLILEQGDRTQEIAENNNRLARTIEQQTSPEALEQQQERIGGIIVTIDCNNAFRTQAVVDGLVDQGLIKRFDVTDNCHNQKEE